MRRERGHFYEVKDAWLPRSLARASAVAILASRTVTFPPNGEPTQPHCSSSCTRKRWMLILSSLSQSRHRQVKPSTRVEAARSLFRWVGGNEQMSNRNQEQCNSAVYKNAADLERSRERDNWRDEQRCEMRWRAQYSLAQSLTSQLPSTARPR